MLTTVIASVYCLWSRQEFSNWSLLHFSFPSFPSSRFVLWFHKVLRFEICLATSCLWPVRNGNVLIKDSRHSGVYILTQKHMSLISRLFDKTQGKPATTATISIQIRMVEDVLSTISLLFSNRFFIYRISLSCFDFQQQRRPNKSFCLCLDCISTPSHVWS